MCLDISLYSIVTLQYSCDNSFSSSHLITLVDSDCLEWYYLSFHSRSLFISFPVWNAPLKNSSYSRSWALQCDWTLRTGRKFIHLLTSCMREIDTFWPSKSSKSFPPASESCPKVYFAKQTRSSFWEIQQNIMTLFVDLIHLSTRGTLDD